VALAFQADSARSTEMMVSGRGELFTIVARG